MLETTPLPAELTVSVECAAELPPALCDARQLQIVFSNLVRNAREAMLPQGGSLTITAKPSGDEVAVTVSDTGTGIACENLERILEPLYSTKARGIGLGLAITRSIVEKHGGTLRAASELGVGSQFTVCLPSAGTSARATQP